jgi:hypothetical protein
VVSELLRDVSLIIASWAAVYGIDAWRREYRGRRQIELAEQTLALFYEAVDAIRAIRHPLTLGHEYGEEKRDASESEAQFKARQQANVVFTRYQRHQELFNRIHSMRYQFMAQFGSESARPFDDLRGEVNKIFTAARMLATLWAYDRQHSSERWEKERERVEKFEAIFWDRMSEDDPINPKLNTIIQDIEGSCRTIISGKGTLHHLLNLNIFNFLRWKRN